jgi:aminocarboxymuconate-semialdehyde decarboxylase
MPIRHSKTARQRKSAARYSVPVIDTHAHWYPQQFIEVLDREAADNGATMSRNAKGAPVFKLPHIEQRSVMPPLMVDLDLMRREMDKRRVDTMVLSLTNPMVYWAPPAFALKLSQTWNNASTAAYTAFPDRFIGTIMLPMHAPELAVPELERAAKLPGMRAVYMAEAINGVNLHDKSFWPVYAKCEALGLPILLHPVYPCGVELMGEFFMRNLLGNPYEAGVAACSLVLGGVMDAFPKLTVMLPHAGGPFPWLIGRIDYGIKVRAELQHMKKPASKYLRRFYYDTVTHQPQILRYLIDFIGDDRIMLGSDYNQDMCDLRPVDFLESVPRLTKKQREIILGVNAMKLLKIRRN